jgi:uncharacterized protein (DUF1697 family)
MPCQIVLLRGINVGGRNLVPMAKLRAHLEALGFTGVHTLLQSGNLVLRGGRWSAAGLERIVAEEVAKRFRVQADCVARTADAWSAAVAANPFPAEAASDPGRLHAVFTREPFTRAQVERLRAAIVGPETVRAGGRELFVYYPDGAGTSKLTLDVIEKHVGSRGTARNWNTVLKIAALAGG